MKKEPPKTPVKKNRKKKPSAKMKICILLGITFLFFGLIYGIAALYFHTHFLFGTVINGMNCESLTVQEVKDRLQDHISEYSLTIYAKDDHIESISAEELGMLYADDKGVERLMNQQNPLLWIRSLSRSDTFEVAANMTYDPAVVPSIVDTLECMQEEYLIAPADAHIIDNGETYVIVPEVSGNTIVRDTLISIIVDAVNTGKTELYLEDHGVYEHPSIYSDNALLNQQLADLNRLTGANITYDMGDGRLYTIDRAMIQSWLVQGGDGTFSLDRAKAYDFIKQMAYDTDTFGLAHQFKTTLGPTITLAKGGDYGWVINKDKTTDALLEAINNQTQGVIEPIYKYKGIARGINDIGGTYVEICITEQKMWCYQDGQLVVETSIVTGNHSTGYDTPSGSVWAIDAKKKDVAFTRYDVDVTFWLPFNDQVGIHDASWRDISEYNGSTYLTNGSHGCINTPYAAAEKIFNVMNIGDPVIVYYSTSQPVGPQPTQQTSVG